MDRNHIVIIGIAILVVLLIFYVRSDIKQIESDLAYRTHQALSNKNLEWVDVEVDGQTIILKGRTGSGSLRDLAGEIAVNVRGVEAVNNKITLIKPDVNPSARVFQTKITKNTTGISFSGYAPDNKSKDFVVGLARIRMGKSNVRDKTKITTNAPQGWRRAMEVAIECLLKLNKGEVNLSGNRLKLSGDVANQQIKERILRKFSSDVPKFYRIEVDLTEFNQDSNNPVPQSFTAPEQRTPPLSCFEQFSGVLSNQWIHFDPNDTAIDEKGMEIIGRLAEFIRSCPRARIRIIGHADSKGLISKNQELSERRARKVLDALVDKGASRRRLIAIGYGESQSIANNDTEQGRLLNRRVEFKYVKGES